jgi:KipI family sensor histidine kinase inhibitor
MPDGPDAPTADPTIAPFGDAGLLVTFGERADPVLTGRARALARAFDERRATTPGIGRSVPAHASVLVPFDPLAVDVAAVSDLVREGIRAAATAPAAEPDETVVEIVVRYGGADGPDLDDVAERHGLSPADVVELHANARYRVLFLGFAPGFAYLGGLPPALATSRRATPRERVPAGSVGIAGEQTGIYPRSMPGGWNLIGRTDADLFDPVRAEPALLRPGAVVRFVPAR